MANCLCEFVSTVWVRLYGYARGYSQAEQCGPPQQEAVLDQFNTRLVQLELLSRRCIGDARRHRASGAKGLFRSKMLEHRRLQAQMMQLQRFKENTMAQFDALSNHELNRTVVLAMQGMVGVNKGRVTAIREDAESVMGDLHDSLSQVKDLSEFLGQPIASVDDVDDAELESDFLNETKVGEEAAVLDNHHQTDVAIAPSREEARRGVEDLLLIRPMLPSY
jgi:hypothetical protein